MAVLLDTSFFVAYINSRDRNHQRSRELATDIFPQIRSNLGAFQALFRKSLTILCAKSMFSDIK